MPYKPQFEPKSSPYKADVKITSLGEKIGDPAQAADYPKHIIRYRNDRWDESVGLDTLTEK